MSKLAIIFPGIGYGLDKPLLYYSRKLLNAKGYTVKGISYDETGLTLEQIQADPQPSVERLIEAAKGQLSDTDLSAFEEILIVSKSIGTVAATAFDKFGKIGARHVLFTPIENTFMFLDNAEMIAFLGTKDFFAEYEKVEKICKEKNIPLYKIVDGNHSLETGDVLKDMEELRKIFEKVDEFSSVPSAF